MSIASDTPCGPGSLCVRGLGPGYAPAEPGATPAGRRLPGPSPASSLRRAARRRGRRLLETIVQGRRCGEPQIEPSRARTLRGFSIATLWLRSCFVNAPCLHSAGWHSRACRHGEVAEWLKAPHSKCGVRATVPGVRIPPSPPFASTCKAIAFCFSDRERKPPEMFEELRLRHSPLRAQRFFRRSFTRIAREFSRWQFRSPVAYGAVLRREISPTAQRDDGGGRNGYAFSSSSSRVTRAPGGPRASWTDTPRAWRSGRNTGISQRR